MNRPIWTDWPDGSHTTYFGGLYVIFRVGRKDFFGVDMYEIQGWITTNPYLSDGHKRFTKRVSVKDLSYQKAFETPLDLFKELANMVIYDEAPKKEPCLSLMPDFEVMCMCPGTDGIMRGYCELDKGHEGKHRRGEITWE